MSSGEANVGAGRRRRYNVAVVGATGAVGTAMLRVLEERRFPVKRIRLLASERSAGRRLRFNGAWHPVEALTPRAFDGMDLALFSAGAARSAAFAPEAVRRGAIVVDNSSAFRLQEGVPLVVPEVNPQALRSHRGLIANPNCSTIIMLVPLAPLHRAARIRRITVATYQSVSGAGSRAMWQLLAETAEALRRLGGQQRSAPRAASARLEQMLGPAPRRPTGSAREGRPATIPPASGAGGVGALSQQLNRLTAAPLTAFSSLRVLPAQIAFNVIPQVDLFLKGGATREELKMVHETRKILGAPQLQVSATCVRVPVFVGHSEAIWIETERPLSVERARTLLRQAPGVRMVDASERGAYPLPLSAAGQDDVLVGRLRKDDSLRNGLALWVSGDNLRKGAATNAIQIAELLTA
jgi:aspartate-semialdehyde dehydrogenase